MNLELHKELRKKRTELNNNYIFSKLTHIRNNNNTENITEDETNQIINLIKEDYNKEKENLIQNILEQNFENKKFKFLYNKEKYISKQKDIILSIIDTIRHYLAIQYKINNDYSLGYCKYYAQLCIDAYKDTKNYILLKWITVKLSSLEEIYSERLKSLYRLSHNYEELNNIRKYESINRNYQLEQIEENNRIINAMSKNIKILKRNCNNL